MKNLKKHTFVAILLYSGGYIIYSFVTWTLINPIQWIVKINQYSEITRVLILFNIVIFHLIVSMIVELLSKNWKK